MSLYVNVYRLRRKSNRERRANAGVEQSNEGSLLRELHVPCKVEGGGEHTAQRQKLEHEASGQYLRGRRLHTDATRFHDKSSFACQSSAGFARPASTPPLLITAPVWGLESPVDSVFWGLSIKVSHSPLPKERAGDPS